MDDTLSLQPTRPTQQSPRHTPAVRLLAALLAAIVTISLFGASRAAAADPPVAVTFDYLSGGAAVSQAKWGSTIQIKTRGTCYANQFLTVWHRGELGHQWRPMFNKKVANTCTTIALPALPVSNVSYAVTRSTTSPDPNAPLSRSSLSGAKSLLIIPRTFTSAMYGLVDYNVRPGMQINASPESAGRTVRVQGSRNGAWVDFYTTKVPAGGKFNVGVPEGQGKTGIFYVRVIMQLGTVNIRPADLTIRRIAGAEPTITNTTAAEVSSTYRSGCPVGPSGLSTIRMYYRDYGGVIRSGLITVKRSMAPSYAAAFDEAFRGGQRIQRMDSANLFGGDDIKIMAAGNTVAFNCRQVVGNPYALSPHSYGYAIDINQRENPYRDPQGRWYPVATYAYSRPAGVTGLHTSSSPIVKALRARGFAWFSGWDWHHFENP